jgi:hypothetical protein
LIINFFVFKLRTLFKLIGEALTAFGGVAEQLLQDVQERLVFRAYLYLRTDIALYNPSPGDLAYPEKLYMMQVYKSHY